MFETHYSRFFSVHFLCRFCCYIIFPTTALCLLLYYYFSCFNRRVVVSLSVRCLLYCLLRLFSASFRLAFDIPGSFRFLDARRSLYLAFLKLHTQKFHSCIVSYTQTRTAQLITRPDFISFPFCTNLSSWLFFDFYTQKNTRENRVRCRRLVFTLSPRVWVSVFVWVWGYSTRWYCEKKVHQITASFRSSFSLSCTLS